MNLVLFCRHSSHIALLERELDWMRTQMLHERTRAEVAISELLRLKVGTDQLHPLAVPTPGERPRSVDELMTNPEFAAAGSTE